jgi:hypothetical protein
MAAPLTNILSGKTVGRFLKHGAEVSDYSTSESDPILFLTACHDAVGIPSALVWIFLMQKC